MTVTITRDPEHVSGPILPDLLQGYTSEQPARTNVHFLLNSTAPAYDLKPAGLRAGSMTLVFRDARQAHRARASHAGAGVFTLIDTQLPDVFMTYVVTGTVRIEPDAATGAAWLVTVGYQEVQA